MLGKNFLHNITNKTYCLAIQIIFIAEQLCFYTCEFLLPPEFRCFLFTMNQTSLMSLLCSQLVNACIQMSQKLYVTIFNLKCVPLEAVPELNAGKIVI